MPPKPHPPLLIPVKQVVSDFLHFAKILQVRCTRVGNMSEHNLRPYAFLCPLTQNPPFILYSAFKL